MNTIERGTIQSDESARRRDEEDVEKAGDAQEMGAAGIAGKRWQCSLLDVEKLTLSPGPIDKQKELPPLKALSFLDRFLVIWIILAMGIGIALGNTVDSVGPALQKGEFVGVSIPIGMCLEGHKFLHPTLTVSAQRLGCLS
jgi:ACR3 family arsenite transporter